MDLKDDYSAGVDIKDIFPADSVIAAAINQKHGLTTVEAVGQTRRQTIIVEEIRIGGVVYHRLKKTQFFYFRNKNDALIAAKTGRIKLDIYGEV